jgi:DNA-binding NarL/FixJ family response regulator
LESPERADFAHDVAVARGKLSEREFAEAWAAGAAMSLEDALASALAPEEVAGGASPAGPRSAATPLTPREREVAVLIAQGMSNREIATRLVVAERTAEGHVQSILNKLGVSSRTQIAVWAVEHGMGTAPVDRQHA